MSLVNVSYVSLNYRCFARKQDRPKSTEITILCPRCSVCVQCNNKISRTRQIHHKLNDRYLCYNCHKSNLTRQARKRNALEPKKRKMVDVDVAALANERCHSLRSSSSSSSKLNHTFQDDSECYICFNYWKQLGKGYSICTTKSPCKCQALVHMQCLQEYRCFNQQDACTICLQSFSSTSTKSAPSVSAEKDVSGNTEGLHKFKIGATVLDKHRTDRSFIVVKHLPNLMYKLRWKEYPTLLKEANEDDFIDPANPSLDRKRKRRRVAK